MRVQVNLSDDMVVKIDAYAKAMGVSRSAFCATLIGKDVMGLDKELDFPSNDLGKYLLKKK